MIIKKEDTKNSNFNSYRPKETIDCHYDCQCWFEFKSSEEVTQSCIYHNKRLIMRSDVKKHFDNNYKKISSNEK